MSEKYVRVIMKKCPVCGTVHFLRLTEEQEKEWLEYTHFGGLIQKKCPNINKFGREFIKSGYCPSCQEKLFGNVLEDKSAYFSQNDTSDSEIINTFMKETFEMDSKEAILSNAANTLSITDKWIYIYEFDLEEELYVDENGNVLEKEY